MINKLFNYLLNRNPNQEEIIFLQNKNQKQVNNYILSLKEYKDFIDEEKFKIINIVNSEIGIIENSNIIDKLLNILRNNNYNYQLIEKIIDKKKKEIKNLIDNEITKLIEGPITNIDYQYFYITFFNNNFDYKNLEFIIVNSDSFKEYVEKEIDVLYEKLF